MSGTVFVDADACPVRAEAETVAMRHGWGIVMVTNGGIRPPLNPRVRLLIVPEGPDVADDRIHAECAPGDLVITADIPLADRVISKGAQVVKPDGTRLDSRNIGGALATRDLMTGLRSADPFRQGGGKSFGKADRSRFLGQLDQAIRDMEQTHG